MNASLDKAVFDEKFQINTILELDPDTGLPSKEKVSKMTVCLDKSMGGTEIGEAEFNMADFKFGEYKIVRLYLRKSEANTLYDFNPEQTFIDLALKGTRSSGLVKQRSSAAKDKSSTQLPSAS